MAFEFPYTFVAGGVARAAEVMADLNKIKKEFDEGVENIRTGAVKAASIAAGAVGHAALGSGYGYKLNNGFVAVSIPNGSQLGAVGTFAHGLGTTPVGFDIAFSSGANFAITFEPRLIAWDATNITWQMVANSPMPGLFEGGAYWTAWCNA